MAKKLTDKTDLTQDRLFSSNIDIISILSGSISEEVALSNILSPFIYLDDNFKDTMLKIWDMKDDVRENLKKFDDIFYLKDKEKYHCIECGSRLFFRTEDLCRKCEQEYEREVCITEAEELLQDRIITNFEL